MLAHSHENEAVLRLRPDSLDEPRVLVVEDDLDLMNVIQRMTRAFDPSIEIDWVTRVDDALDRLARRHYRMVLADYHLENSRCGLALLDPCEQLQPRATFAMISSDAFDQLEGARAHREFPFLRKPFTALECFTFIGGALS